MIVKSTPWAITWKEDEDHIITFRGEWSLEPKFYLALPAKMYWDNSRSPIEEGSLQQILREFQDEATARGWNIVIERETITKLY